MTNIKTGFSTDGRLLAVFLIALALAVLAGFPALRAQAPGAGQENSFNSTTQENGNLAGTVNSDEQVNMEDIEVINDPEEGVRFVYKHRWKDWVERALYLVLANMAILGILASLPKNVEYTLIISYVVAGISFQFSFWILLCGILILQLKSAVGFYALPVAAALFGATYYLLMKVKKADVDLTALKDSYKQQGGTDGADQRLSSVDGSPGDWDKRDFIN